MATLGKCSDLGSSQFIFIDEVTTVGSVYCLSQFMNSSGGIGSSPTGTQDLANAFSTVTNIVNNTTGFARATTPRGNGVVPQQELNSLANLLVPCVNSANSSSPSCTALFAASPSAANVTPTNTLTALLNIAQNPARNVTTLFNLATANAAFQPSLTASPSDWTVAIGFSSGGAGPSALAVDSIGNVWITNYGLTGGGASSLSLITTTGVPAVGNPLISGSIINGASGVAIDTADNVWIANRDNSSTMSFTSSFNGSNYFINTGSGPYSGLGLGSPIGVAVDGSNNVWFANNGNNSVFELTSGGPGSISYTGGGLSAPRGIAMDTLGNAWVTNTAGASITKVNPNASSDQATAYSGGGLTSPVGIAIDASSNTWMTDLNLGQIAKLGPTGSPITSSAGYSGGGITGSNGDAIDGSGNLWVANSAGNSLSQLKANGSAVTPAAGYQGGLLASPTAIALDGAGNVWLANSAPVSSSGLAITVTEFIGLASPVVTPISLGLHNSKLGQRP